MLYFLLTMNWSKKDSTLFLPLQIRYPSLLPLFKLQMIPLLLLLSSTQVVLPRKRIIIGPLPLIMALITKGETGTEIETGIEIEIETGIETETGIGIRGIITEKETENMMMTLLEEIILEERSPPGTTGTTVTTMEGVVNSIITAGLLKTTSIVVAAMEEVANSTITIGLLLKTIIIRNHELV